MDNPYFHDILKMFVADTQDSREYLHKPFAFEDYVCASNGHAVVYLSGDQSDLAPAPKNIVGTLKKWCETKPERLMSFPDINIPETVSRTCPECDGTGVVNFDNEFSEYDFTCKSCHGFGTLRTVLAVPMEGFTHDFSAELLKKINSIRTVQIANIDDYMYFQFDSGFGVCSHAPVSRG